MSGDTRRARARTPPELYLCARVFAWRCKYIRATSERLIVSLLQAPFVFCLKVARLLSTFFFFKGPRASLAAF